MEVGELRITGSIDTLNIEKGINGIILDMKKVDEKSQSVNSDFERMNSTAGKLATALGLIGASDALLNLAKSAPQIAPAMASIQMSMLQLGFAVGQALQPAFDWFANTLNKLVQWAQDNPDLFKDLLMTLTGLGIAAATLTIGAGLYTLFGFLTNPIVATIALALWDIYEAFKAITDLASGKAATPGKDIGAIVGGIGGAILGGIGGTAVAPGVGTALGIAGGFAAGYAGGGAIGSLFDKKTTTTSSGTYFMNGQGYSGVQNTSQNPSTMSQSLITLINNLNQSNSRRTINLNLSSLNLGY